MRQRSFIARHRVDFEGLRRPRQKGFYESAALLASGAGYNEAKRRAVGHVDAGEGKPQVRLIRSGMVWYGMNANAVVR